FRLHADQHYEQSGARSISRLPVFQRPLMYLDANQHLYGLSEAGQTSTNAFQKAPPNPGSGDGEAHVWVGKYTMNAAGAGGVNLSGPYQWGAPYGIPILYRATGRSPHCDAGIAPCACTSLQEL